jgi:AAA15 family ATPase/GTPase
MANSEICIFSANFCVKHMESYSAMLLTFSATNYRSIKETQTLSMVGTALKGAHPTIQVDAPGVSHGVLPCAVIYGANASGKSNLLSAFSSLRRMVLRSHSSELGTSNIGQFPFLLDKEFADKPTQFEISFLVQKVRYDFSVKFDNNNILEESLFSFPEGRRRKLYERASGEVTFGPEMKGAKKSLVEFMKESSLFISTATQNKHPELFQVSSFFNEVFLSTRVSVESSLLNNAFGKNEIDIRVIKFLEALGTGVVSYRQIASDTPAELFQILKDFMVVVQKHADPEGKLALPPPDEKKFEIQLAHFAKDGSEKFFSGELESAGTRRLLILMNEIFKVLDNGDIAIVDELDASLHSLAVEAIIKLFADAEFNKTGAQLIATTHDTNLLNPNILRRDEIWFVEKQGDGSSSYYSLAEIVNRKGEIFEKSYLQGRYGALPPHFDRIGFEATQAVERPVSE